MRAPMIVIAALGWAAMAQAQTTERRAPLSADLRFLTPAGQPLDRVTPGAPFQVEVTLTSATGGLPRSLSPMAWMRPVALSDLPCTETAAAYRATGRGASGAIDLNGIVLGVLTRDNALGVLDPDRSVGAANLAAAHRLPGPPGTMIADPSGGRFVLSDPAGTITAIAPLGAPTVLAAGLAEPGPMIAAARGGVWVIETGTGDLLRVDDGGVAQRLHIGARAFAPSGRGLAVLAGNDIISLDEVGSVLARHAAPGALALAVRTVAGDRPEDRALVWLAPGGLRILWPGASVPLALDPGRAHDRLAISPEGRYVFAFGGGAEVSVIDLSTSRVAQVVGSGSPVAEIAFVPDAAFLRTADGTMVGVMDLRLIRAGEPAVIGQKIIGPPDDAPQTTGLLVPLTPEPAMLVVHAPSYTGFVFDITHATSGKPPMEALRLRGGIPRAVVSLDTGLRESAPGVYRTTTRIPAAAAYELVVSTGIGQASFCAALPIDVPPPDPATLPGHITAEAHPGGYRLGLRDGADRPLADRTGRVVLQALIGNWRAAGDFTTDPQGMIRGTLIPSDTPMAVIVDLAGQTFAPLVLEPDP